jgi:magnesium chelatase subunit D
VILLTDGKANVPLNGGDAWKDALEAAGRVNCAAVVVDSAIGGSAAVEGLAGALRGTRIGLDELSGERLLRIAHEVAW